MFQNEKKQESYFYAQMHTQPSCVQILLDQSTFFFRLWCRMDQEFYRRHSVTEMKEDSNKTLSAAARRSFFRRKQKHKRSSSKDSKEMVALDAISTDSIPFLDGEQKALDVFDLKMVEVMALIDLRVLCVRLRQPGIPAGPEGRVHLSPTSTRPRAADRPGQGDAGQRVSGEVLQMCTG